VSEYTSSNHQDSLASWCKWSGVLQNRAGLQFTQYIIKIQVVYNSVSSYPFEYLTWHTSKGYWLYVIIAQKHGKLSYVTAELLVLSYANENYICITVSTKVLRRSG